MPHDNDNNSALIPLMSPEAAEDHIGQLIKSSMAPFIEQAKQVAALNQTLKEENALLKDGTTVADLRERITTLTNENIDLKRAVKKLEDTVVLVCTHPAEVFEWRGTRADGVPIGASTSYNFRACNPVIMSRENFNVFTTQHAEAVKDAKDWKRRALRDAEEVARLQTLVRALGGNP